jgi:hypothetical protein
MLVLHVGIEGRIGQVSLVAVVASVISTLDIVFRPALLLLPIRIIFLSFAE